MRRLEQEAEIAKEPWNSTETKVHRSNAEYQIIKRVTTKPRIE